MTSETTCTHLAKKRRSLSTLNLTLSDEMISKSPVVRVASSLIWGLLLSTSAAPDGGVVGALVQSAIGWVAVCSCYCGEEVDAVKMAIGMRYMQPERWLQLSAIQARAQPCGPYPCPSLRLASSQCASMRPVMKLCSLATKRSANSREPTAPGILSGLMASHGGINIVLSRN